MKYTNIDNIPTELKKDGLFCGWKYELDEGRMTKVPYNLQTGRKAKSDNPDTFCSFNQAIQLVLNGDYDGLGVGVFNGICGIDIDHCIDENGELSDLAKDIVQRANTYTEVSPSGTGLRLFGYAPGYKYDKERYYLKNSGNGTEIYVAGNTKRFLTITGNARNDNPVRGVTEALPQIQDKYMLRPQKKATPVERPQIVFDLSDAELIERAKNSKNGDAFRRLWEGDRSGYPSESEADLALCNMLAFWCAGDTSRMDALFRQSGRYREKWEREDYRTDTLQKAVDGCQNFYDGHNEDAWEKYLREWTDSHKTDVSTSTEQDVLELVSLDQIEETEVEWLFPGRIPKGEVNIFAGEGGTGKTSTVCQIIASISNGTKSILDEDIPEGWSHPDKGEVIYFSSEDDFAKVLKGRLRQNGADMKNIKTIETSDERFREVKFNSPLLEKIIARYRPTLCVFDPLQSFIPPEVNMSARNEMRNCLNALVGLGHKYGTTFIILMHCNKKAGMYGRYRMADSADIWDIARSVFLFGYADREGIRYMSNEKNNYGKMAETILFGMNDGVAKFKGTTEKKDYDFVSEANRDGRKSAPDREEAKDFILEQLLSANDHTVPVNELDELALNIGFSKSTYSRAKTDLKKEGRTKTYGMGYGEAKKFYITLIHSDFNGVKAK